MMTVLYNNNFDANALDALPAGWSAAMGTWAVKTDGAVSGRALRSTSNTALDAVLYTAVQVADGEVTYDFLADVDDGTAGAPLTPIFRASAGFATGYLCNFNLSGVFSFFRRSGGQYNQLDVKNLSLPAISAGDTLRVAMRFVGSTFEFRLWNITKGGSRPNAAIYTAPADNTYPTGFTGVLLNIDPASGASKPSLDNFSVSDTAVAPIGVTIARTDGALYYSPNSWLDDGTARVSANPGAYVKFNFTGTSLTLLTTALSSMSAYPQIRAIVDGIAYDIGLDTSTSFPIVTGLSGGTHTCEIYLRASLWSAGSWWNRVNALKVTGLLLDAGASVSAPTLRTNVLLAFGDSLTQAYFVDSTTSPAGDDALGNYVSPLAEALNAEYGQVGWGGQNFAGAGVSDVPAFNTAYSSVTNGYGRLSNGQFAVQPTYISVMFGTNGNPSQADVATAIANLRSAAPNATIFMIVPGCGTGRPNITAAVAAANDSKVKLIDAGTRYQTGLGDATAGRSPSEAAFDGVHYKRRTNARLGAEWTRQIQRAIEPRRFTVVPS